MTNLTLTQILTRMASDLKQHFARLNHTHPASDITSGTLGTSRGGTGITSNPSMLTNLGSTSSANVFQSSPRPGVTGTLAVANGGTGGSTAALARTNLGVPSATDLANIESSIAYVESTTAKTNHAVGDYFMLGDVLMCATAAIATGEQITTSNATPATVQGQIDTLRDSLGQGLEILFQNVEATKSYTVPVGGTPIDVSFSIPDGYTMIDAEISSFGGVAQLFERAKHYAVGGNSANFFVGTQASTSISGTLTASAKCIKITG